MRNMSAPSCFSNVLSKADPAAAERTIPFFPVFFYIAKKSSGHWSTSCAFFMDHSCSFHQQTEKYPIFLLTRK
jgi:hypothetical protein